MTCHDVRERLLDRLDDLLEAPDAAAVDAHVAACASCAEEASRLARLRERLTAPWEVGAPPPLPARPREIPRVVRSWPAAAFTHVLTFAAGILVAVLVLSAQPSPQPAPTAQVPQTSEPPAAEVPLPPESPPSPALVFSSPRRIR